CETRPEPRRGQPEEDDSDAEDPRGGRLTPVLDGGECGERNLEDAECVDFADAQVNGERGRRNEPAVEAGRRDDPPTVEKPGSRIGCAAAGRSGRIGVGHVTTSAGEREGGVRGG